MTILDLILPANLLLLLCDGEHEARGFALGSKTLRVVTCHLNDIIVTYVTARISPSNLCVQQIQQCIVRVTTYPTTTSSLCVFIMSRVLSSEIQVQPFHFSLVHVTTNGNKLCTSVSSFGTFVKFAQLGEYTFLKVVVLQPHFHTPLHQI